MNQTERKRRARAWLWLQAERAMGVSGVPLRPASVCLADEQQARPTSPQPLAAAQKPNLFDGPEAPASAAVPSAPLSKQQKLRLLEELDRGQVRGCTRCRLCESRTQTVFGEGSPDAEIFFIGEGPGETEDQTGRPFVGRAGELLDRMIGAMGLRREQVYIANIVKCRPPGNREPAADEAASCAPFLERQIEIVHPKLIVTLGRAAAQHMLQKKISITKIRGRWQSWRGIKLMPTYHPAYILRQYTRETRAAVWSDLQQVMLELGLPNRKPLAAQEV